jgi:hypothetical protein
VYAQLTTAMKDTLIRYTQSETDTDDLLKSSMHPSNLGSEVSRALTCSRIAVIFVMLTAAAGVGTFSFVTLNEVEQQAYQDKVSVAA